MKKFIESNKKLWDSWTKLHSSTKNRGYDIEAFKAGKTDLQKIELAELGNVTGKSLLHLQCHFGLDTLSWAREGAIVTGIDLSSEGIQTAKKISEECEINADFICSNIYDLPKVLDKKFDIVFTSYGALNWLYDIDEWAKIVAHYLKSNGTFYMVEFHPFTFMFDDNWENISNSYFFNENPIITEEKGSYANREADFSETAYEWAHPLGDVITALRKVGLIIDFVHEFPYNPFDCFPNLEETKEGEYTIKGKNKGIPLTYSIKATYLPELSYKK